MSPSLGRSRPWSEFVEAMVRVRWVFDTHACRILTNRSTRIKARVEDEKT